MTLSKISLEWFRGEESEKDKKDFELVLRHSTRLLTRLDEIIDHKLSAIETTENRKETYENPAYPYLQAHLNGRRAALNELKQLLSFINS